MRKIVVLALASAVAVWSSGCALVGRHSAPIEGGRKTTVGLLSIDAMGNGYPMIPFYSRVDLGK
jgi:uncharacterized protein YceK